MSSRTFDLSFGIATAKGPAVALTAIDRSILQHCLARDPGAWNDFVDRFLGLVYHVVHYTAHLRSNPMTPELVEEIAQEILTKIAAGDYALLRQYRGKSSLAAYLTVIARRICVGELVKRRGKPRKPLPSEYQPKLAEDREEVPPAEAEPEEEIAQTRPGIESLEQVQKLIRKLPAKAREVVRMFYLEGRTYEDISTELNLPVTTIGPILVRARKMLRQFQGGTQNSKAPRKRG